MVPPADRLLVTLPQTALAGLRERLQQFADTTFPRLEGYRSALHALEARAEVLGESSTGSFLGYQSELYYREFQKPPPSDVFSIEWGFLLDSTSREQSLWRPRTYAEVVAVATSDYDGPPFDEMSREIQEGAVALNEIVNEIITELAPLRGAAGYEDETRLMEGLEQKKWGFTPKEFLRPFLPKSVVSRDTAALQAPRKAPPHLVFQANVSATSSRLTAIDDVLRTARRLLRQVELKSPSPTSGHVASTVRPSRRSRRMPEADEPPDIARSLRAFRTDYLDPARVAFIMMQFGTTRAHDAIVRGIVAGLASHGITGVRADHKQYHDAVFPNVLTYMHGCGLAVAVFERIEVEQFNPNVALEVGYMLALGKPVCLLKDRNLRALHADLGGMIYRSFDPQDPEGTIPPELEKWLADKGL